MIRADRLIHLSGIYADPNNAADPSKLIEDSGGCIYLSPVRLGLALIGRKCLMQDCMYLVIAFLMSSIDCGSAGRPTPSCF